MQYKDTPCTFSPHGILGVGWQEDILRDGLNWIGIGVGMRDMKGKGRARQREAKL